MLDPDVPTTVLQVLLLNEQDGEDVDLQKVVNLMLWCIYTSRSSTSFSGR